MIQTTTDFTVTTADIAALRALVKLQNDTGPGMPPPGQAQLWDLFGVINDMAYDHYRLATNAQLKSWMDAIFNALIQTQTCYKVNGAGLYVLYMYYQYCTSMSEYYPGEFPPGGPSRGGIRDFDNLEDKATGPPWLFFAGTNRTWYIPGAHAAFFDSIHANVDAINTELTASRDKADTNIVWLERHGGTRKSLDEVLQFQKSRFDLANWTDSYTLVQNLQKTTIWQEQSGTVTNLLKEPTLTADAYFFLLHLLIGLGTSNQTDRQLAQKIVSVPADSMEYPNDTFSNQLVYLTLMYFADPLGDFGYDNTQLQGVLNDLSGAIVSTDPASAAIKQSLTKSIKILHSDSSYPMTDPYNPNIGFNTRQSDTLAALDSARSSLAYTA